MPPDDRQFRKGASHGAEWFFQVTRSMLEEGRSSEEITDRLSDLGEVLTDYRNDRIEMPPGPPWEWPSDSLEHFISLRKTEW